MPRRVFLLDDHPLVREWLSVLVAGAPDLEVCGHAEDPASALAQVLKLKPDVIVVDLSLPRGSGLDFIKEVRSQLPGVKLLVLSMHDEASVAERAFRAGANGYAIKRDSGPRIVDAIRSVADGKFYASTPLANELASRVMAGAANTSRDPADVLSDRELEVYRLRGQGRSLKEIAHHLGVSVKTVGSYEARIKEKLGLADAGDLMRQAVLWHERQRGL
jgi:DNA-binding NarL/FixJ family response regulator